MAGDPLGLAYRVMVLTGCRRAELCGFRLAGADEEPTAKSRAGDRLVFLDHDTAGLLRKHRKAQLRAWMAARPAWAGNDLVFCQPDGRPWNPTM